MIIACDIDGVLADFNKGFAKLFPNLDVPLDSPTFPPVWDWPEHYGAEPGTLLAAWKHIETSPTFWDDLDPEPGALDALEHLAAAWEKHEIYFVTNRFGATCKQQSINWLERQGMPDHHGGISLAPPQIERWDVIIPTPYTKAQIIEEIDADLFIDDRPDNFKGVRSKTRCVLINKPYNTSGRMKADNTEVGRRFDRMDSVLAALQRHIPLTTTNPKDSVGATKIPMHLWPETATVIGSLGLLDGALKYERNNWRAAGIRASIYVDALRRHLARWWEGEDLDPDSGLPHESHMLACLAILVDAKATGKLTDDRNQQGAGLFHTMEEMTPHVQRLHTRCLVPEEDADVS